MARFSNICADHVIPVDALTLSVSIVQRKAKGSLYGSNLLSCDETPKTGNHEALSELKIVVLSTSLTLYN